jgi:LDH2 family malate/lactate/ureidoglycolate dehydrogenase
MNAMRCFLPSALEQFSLQVFQAMGADREVAAEVARHLARANASGHDSHGVIRIPKYVDQTDRGELQPSARPTMAHETPVVGLIDAHGGFGHFATAFALDWALGRAREQGAAVAAIRHCTHIGRVGEYSERAAERGYICLMTVGAAGSGVGGLALYGSRRRFFGANPWSMAVPALEHPPVMFDGSTSMIAEGKVRVARAKGVPLPPGCIIDKDGNPSTDPEDFYAGGAMLPLGGEVAAHKGYGLCMISALLGGLAMIDDPAPALVGAPTLPDSEARGRMAGVFLIVINPAAFGKGREYQRMVSETITVAKKVTPAPGVAEILMPGEPEVRSRAQREREGVPLPDATCKELAAIAQRFGVPLPQPLAPR